MLRRFPVVIALAAALGVVWALPPTAVAQPDAYYGMNVSIAQTSRMGDDGSTIWWALPKGKVTVQAGGKRRKVHARGFSTCCYSTAVALRLSNASAMVLMERPLLPKERKRFASRLAWIDGDVMVAHPSNPACTSGLSLNETRAVLKGEDRRFATVYAPEGISGLRQLMFGLFAKSNLTRVYGANVKIVWEGSAISAVASNPAAVAAVAWSAAREEIADGSVCAIPIGGQLPDETSLRKRTYPASVHATLVYGKRDFQGFNAYARRWYTAFIVSKIARDALATGRDRRPLFQ